REENIVFLSHLGDLTQNGAKEELFEPGGAGRPDGGQGPSSPSPGRSVGLSRPGDDPRKD
ncbi:hypothetical protein ABZ281_48840, partial [Streptomyces sp. NPDC006265]|uniref:hypothetical protein n=1 Tax=Streptomyces sp. NPDC006265 TaxID=3156740 RepID=UPI0033AB98EB